MSADAGPAGFQRPGGGGGAAQPGGAAPTSPFAAAVSLLASTPFLAGLLAKLGKKRENQE
jgi:hypothetical protein